MKLLEMDILLWFQKKPIQYTPKRPYVPMSQVALFKGAAQIAEVSRIKQN
jgi:hypothetical protein